MITRKPYLIKQCEFHKIELSGNETVPVLVSKLNICIGKEVYKYYSSGAYATKKPCQTTPISFTTTRTQVKKFIKCTKCKKVFDREKMVKKKSIQPIYYCKKCFRKVKFHDYS